VGASRREANGDGDGDGNGDGDVFGVRVGRSSYECRKLSAGRTGGMGSLNRFVAAVYSRETVPAKKGTPRMCAAKRQKENEMGSGANDDFTTVIGPDAVFKGELKFEKGVRHLGKFDGQIETKGHLLIAEGAELIGEVVAGSINIEGQVKANLKSSGKVSLSASASLEGDLHTNRLEVSEGAVFIGRCVVGPNGSGQKGEPKAASADAVRKEPSHPSKK
jgi:cytoskeletal protein CcmA (bactofilin family)